MKFVVKYTKKFVDGLTETRLVTFDTLQLALDHFDLIKQSENVLTESIRGIPFTAHDISYHRENDLGEKLEYNA